MQLGRSYSRRLKKMKYEIYELYSSARHAYHTIRPAVKTSRPRFNEQITIINNSCYGVPQRVSPRDTLRRAFGVTR